MKIKLFLITVIIFFIFSSHCFSQKVVVIGINHESPDGFSFVATETIPVGDEIYFTDTYYLNTSDTFFSGEGVLLFTVTSEMSSGDVVSLEETTATSNTFNILCSGGCGTAAMQNGSSFVLNSDGEALYAYDDADNDPTNGVTEIYSVLFTGESEPSSQIGGTIFTAIDPTPDYPNAIVIEGFPATSPRRVEYMFDPATLRDGVSQANLQNTTNYLHAQTNQTLSSVPFTNLNLVGSNPVLTVTASPESVDENSASTMTYTFNLSENATSTIIVNFTVDGTATLTTDYSQTGATTFTATTGTIEIANGSNSATITITPVGDTDLEPDETVIITLNSGTGYDAGGPSIATVTILNDETVDVTPLVALTGVNNTTAEGFSFVALDEITSGTIVYFTENSFDLSSLSFTGSESVLSWTAPASNISQGEVVVVKEVSSNTFTVSCDSGSCGIITRESGSFNFAANGETFYAYTDSDNDDSNGITEVHSIIFTGTSTQSGGDIPSSEDPSSIYVGTIVVDGFSAVAPNRTEYDPTFEDCYR